MQEFLGAISLTGIPQPLAYLIAEASRRYDCSASATSRRPAVGCPQAYVTSPDEHLLTTVFVDQNLSTSAFARSARTGSSPGSPWMWCSGR